MYSYNVFMIWTIVVITSFFLFRSPFDTSVELDSTVFCVRLFPELTIVTRNQWSLPRKLHLYLQSLEQNQSHHNP